MKTKTRFMVLIMLSVFAMQSYAQKPEPVYSIVRQEHNFDWYEQQAMAWKQEINKGTNDAMAWVYWYEANRMARNFCDSVKWESKKGDYFVSKEVIVEMAEKAIPNSFELYLLKTKCYGFDKKTSDEALYYETTRSSGAGCYNGNISQSDIRYHAGDHNASLAAGIITPTSGGTPLQFNYTYDHLNRLTLSQTSEGFSRFGEQMGYDKHGNITSLQRSGIYQHNWSNSYTPNHDLRTLDNLTYGYTYEGNRLTSIGDAASSNDANYTGSQDFKGGTSQTGEYAYDANGNMSSDLNKNISTIKYNFLNLPDTTQMVNGHMRACNYDASGDKILVYHRTVNSSGVTMQPGWTLFNHSTGYTITGTVITMYLDNVIYKDYNVDKLIDSDGILIRTNDYPETTPVFKRNYYIKDHLGNVRVVFDDTGIIKQVNNYYPFGMEYGESAETQSELTHQDYLFGGKEFDRKFQINTYDFEARSYDQTSGRFTTMDPMAEKYYSISPYAYCANKPVKFIDPNGMWIETAWDLGSLVTGAKSFINNVKQGNLGDAVADGVGVYWMLQQLLLHVFQVV